METLKQVELFKIREMTKEMIDQQADVEKQQTLATFDINQLIATQN